MCYRIPSCTLLLLQLHVSLSYIAETKSACTCIFIEALALCTFKRNFISYVRHGEAGLHKLCIGVRNGVMYVYDTLIQSEKFLEQNFHEKAKRQNFAKNIFIKCQCHAAASSA